MKPRQALVFSMLVVGAVSSACSAPDPAPQESAQAATPEEAVGEPAATNKEVQEAETSTPEAEEAKGAMEFRLISSVFAEGQPIPARFSCDGEDISPPLAWTEPPTRTQSFALIFDDPDAPAGIWVHWVLFNIPATARSLPEAIPPDPTLADGSIHGTSSFRSLGYGGPCPPGGTHRYFFKLYALDTALQLGVGATKAQVLAAMEGHILAETELMGTYAR